MRKINIAIIGLGNIGSYLFKYLNDNKKILTEKNNCLPVVKYVSAKNKKRKRQIKIKKNQWLRNYLDSTRLNDVDLIISHQKSQLENLIIIENSKKYYIVVFAINITESE